MAVKQMIDEAQLAFTPEQQARRAKADQKAAEKAGGLPEAKQAVGKQATVAKQAVRNEVVIVGTLRFMLLPYEIAEETNAVSARRICRRVKGKPEPTTAVVLTFDIDPPQPSSCSRSASEPARSYPRPSGASPASSSTIYSSGARTTRSARGVDDSTGPGNATSTPTSRSDVRTAGATIPRHRPHVRHI